MPIHIKNHARFVNDFLAEMASQAGGSIDLRIIDPEPDSDDDLAARRSGVSPVKLPTGEDLFLGAALTSGDREVAIPFLDPRRAQFLEYDVLEAIVRLQRTQKPRLGIVSALSIMGGRSSPLGNLPEAQSREWAFVSELRRSFDVADLTARSPQSEQSAAAASHTLRNLPEQLTGPSAPDALLVIHPHRFTPEELYAIDQYVLSGKPTAFFVDSFARVQSDDPALQAVEMQQGMPNFSSFAPAEGSTVDVSQLLRAYGAVPSRESIVMDLKQPTRINIGGEQIEYPGFLSLGSESFSKESPITSQLNSMMMAEATALSTPAASDLSASSLIISSDASREAPTRLLAADPRMARQNLEGDTKSRALAVLLQGTFSSAFPDGRPGGITGQAVAQPSDSAAAASQSAGGANTSAHLAKASIAGAVLVVGDVDFIADGNSVQTLQLGRQLLRRPLNNNLSFAINALETLGGMTELLSVRSRGDLSRPFTRLQEIRLQAQEKYQEEEKRLTEELQSLQKKLNEMQGATIEGNRIKLSDEQQREITRFRDEESRIRKKLRDVRRKLREDIERLGTRLTILNLAVMPFIVSAAGFAFFGARSRRLRKRGGQK